MDVSVPYKRGQRRLGSAVRSSVLGNGLLERARSTSLALLGLTAAVGLAIVALALNQGWPLVAGSPIPPLPPRDSGLAEAPVAARPDAEPRSAPSDDEGTSRRGSGKGEARPARRPGASGTATQAPSAELVVSPSAPADPAGDRSGGGSGHPAQPPPHKPQQASPSPAQPQAAEASPPPPAPPPAAEPEPPAATASEAPTASYVPAWSNGKGHAYGRSGKEAGE
jgi:hypothetical protein